jgi:carboxylesterase type B
MPQPLDALRQGYFQKKPFMIGTNTEETRIFIFEAWNTTVSPMLYAEALLATYGRNVLDILAMYPPNHLKVVVYPLMGHQFWQNLTSMLSCYLKACIPRV